MELTAVQERVRGAAFFMSAMSGVQLTAQDAKTMANNLFADWPEELKEKTAPYCGLVEKVDNEVAAENHMV